LAAAGCFGAVRLGLEAEEDFMPPRVEAFARLALATFGFGLVLLGFALLDVARRRDFDADLLAIRLLLDWWERRGCQRFAALRIARTA
jgi:hypothetical protein